MEEIQAGRDSRGFDYGASLPYSTESYEESQAELSEIVSRLETLYAAGKFKEFEFGTGYAVEVWREVRRLFAFTQRKLWIPWKTRIRLTKMFADAFFASEEPVLTVRYGSACCALWKSRRARKLLARTSFSDEAQWAPQGSLGVGSSAEEATYDECEKELFDMIAWPRMIRAVRNIVLLSPAAGVGELNGRSYEQRTRLRFVQLVKHGSPTKVVLTMARLFRTVAKATPEVDSMLHSEILAYLSPRGHDPSEKAVMEAFTALVPLGGRLEMAHSHISLLMDLRPHVSRTLFYQCGVPLMADFLMIRHERGLMGAHSAQPAHSGEHREASHQGDPKGQAGLSDVELDAVFQAALDALDIPLMSTQASKQHEATLRQAEPTPAFSGGARELLHADAYNAKAHSANSDAFAKVVLYSALADAGSLARLEAMMAAVTTFAHPSNAGSWSTFIAVTVAAIAFEMPSVPLSKPIADRIVAALLSAVRMGVHSTVPIVSTLWLECLRYLAVYSPDIVCVAQLSEVYPSLQHGLHQAQRLATSLAVLQRLARPLAEIPRFRMHLTTLLELALPSLDASDTKRSLLALDLFMAVASVTEFCDVSSPESVGAAAQILPMCVHDLNLELDEETINEVVKGTSTAYPEILTSYMRRVFSLLESASGEQRLGASAAASVLRVLLACSNELFDRLLAIALEELLNTQQQSHDAFAQVCGAFVRANCERSFAPMFAVLSTSIREEIVENRAGAGRSAIAADSKLLRSLSVLNMALLACNSAILLTHFDEVASLLELLQQHTGAAVVYTVANSLHHAIVAFSNYKVVMPGPAKEVGSTSSKPQLAIVDLPCGLSWHIPTAESRTRAAELFIKHVDMACATINEHALLTSRSVASLDAVTTALIFLRTSLGAASTLSSGPTSSPVSALRSRDADVPGVKEARRRILDLILGLYTTLSADDIACLKEALFVAKVLACDVSYERTAGLDHHIYGLYDFERRAFDIRGTHKRFLPPAVLARRAQAFHHQRQAIKTQHRPIDPDTEKLLLIVLDACFSVYPAVRRNAFSALYSPLKIFRDSKVYEHVYDAVLNNTERVLDKGEFERAQGGFALFKYRSFGVQTVGRCPALVQRLFTVCSRAAASDNLQLSTQATFVFFSLLPDFCRFGRQEEEATNEEDAESSRLKFVAYLASAPLTSLHWRDALFRGSALLAISQNPGFMPDTGILKLFLDASVTNHPRVRNVATLGALNCMQVIFRTAHGMPQQSSEIDAPLAEPSELCTGSASDFENDWQQFYTCITIASKASKTQLLQTGFVSPLGSRGWLESVPTPRAPSTPLRLPELQLDFVGLVHDMLAIRRLEPRPELDRLNIMYCLVYRDLVVLSGGKLLALGELQDGESDRNWHRMAAEWACGQLLAVPVLNKVDAEAVIEDAKMTLVQGIQYLSPETLPYWLAALRQTFQHVAWQRLHGVLELLEKEALPTSDEGIKLSLRMALYTEVIAILKWRRPVFLEVAGQWAKFNHNLQTTRESVGDELGAAACGRKPPNTAPRISLPSLPGPYLTSLRQIFETPVAKPVLSRLHLLVRLLQLLGGETCIELLLSHGFPLLIQSAAVRDDPEVISLVSAAFRELQNIRFEPESALKLAEFLAKAMHASSAGQWHSRVRLLLFCQPFFFNHLFVFPASVRRNLMHLVVERLEDPQVEVRDLAADTLSGIIRVSPPREQREYVNQLSKRFQRRIGSHVPLIERHSAVLCLGALIGAFPYESPPPEWVPGLLAALAVHAAGDSRIVGKTTKRILSDFKKTRQDTWHIDQTAFTQDQLDDLDGVLWRNYFA